MSHAASLSKSDLRRLERRTSGDFSFLELGRRDGICVHRVDLNDHLGGRLNNLRFTDAIWESVLFRESGFYANRRLTDEDLLVSGFDLVLRHKA